MPTYDYACTVCGLRAEVIHRIHETGPRMCAACGGPMRKLLSTPTIMFKGSGWAKKDARTAITAGGRGGAEDAAGDAPGASGSADAPGKQAGKDGARNGDGKSASGDVDGAAPGASRGAAGSSGSSGSSGKADSADSSTTAAGRAESGGGRSDARGENSRDIGSSSRHDPRRASGGG